MALNMVELLGKPATLKERIETQRMVVAARRAALEPGALKRMAANVAAMRAQAAELLAKADALEQEMQDPFEPYEAAVAELQQLTKVLQIAENPRLLKLMQLEKEIAKQRAILGTEEEGS